MTQSRGEEFKDDVRKPGLRHTDARRQLTPQEMRPLTALSSARSVLAISQTLGLIACGMAWCWWSWPSLWCLPGLVLIGVAQHGLFILAHEASHHRLFAHRGVNDTVGRLIGICSGISMCTYRVTHRLHHNHLYGEEDPDTAIHGGYPRGRAYLWRKLLADLCGLNAWKTYAYFFGAPAINEITGNLVRPLDDTAPHLRAAARQDRWLVVAFHALAPGLAWGIGGWSSLAWYAALWLLPLLTVLQPILRLRAICEHGAVTDVSSALTAARSNRTRGNMVNRLGRFFLFPHHVNYHLEHHLCPAVPHYRLPELHRLLREKGVLEGAEVRDLSSTLHLIFAPRRHHEH
jgi:fatty acid desaturase